MALKVCGYSMLGVVGENVPKTTERFFAARCTCGAHVTVVDGRIPFHHEGIDERLPDEACEPAPAPTTEGGQP